MAQSTLRACPSVDLTGPADGAVLDDGYRTNFTWDSEPRGTASREWVSVRVDGDGNVSFDDAKHVKAEPRLYKGFARGRPGVYAWAVIFYDAKGNPLCISEPRTYIVAGGSTASLSSDGSASGPAAAAAKAALGRYIIVLTGGNDQFYSGSATSGIEYIDNVNFKPGDEATDWRNQGYTGLEIWGNKHNNVIKGSELSDEIFGGNESCKAIGVLTGCTAGDAIDGGKGDDIIHGGNETCTTKGLLAGCTAGDAIVGGDGNDTIYGGDETCNASGLAACTKGDAIAGGNGNDKIYGEGGNDAISGGNGDDTISGGDGNDAIDGGDGADTLNGDNGNDAISTGVNDGDPDTGSGGNGNDAIANGPGDSVTP